MADMNDEQQYEGVIKVLKGLPAVNAAPDFEMSLRRRLNTETYSKKENWFNKLIQPSKLIPSAALAAAAVFMLFFFNIESTHYEDPFSTMPKIREDILTGTQAEEYVLDKLNRDGVMGIQNAANVSNIMKSGLNFRQINLSESDKMKLREMKNKIKEWLRK